MKNILKFAVAAITLTASTVVYGQCPTGRCFMNGGVAYRYAATYRSYGYTRSIPVPCGQVVETPAPCEAAQIVECEPTPAACEPVRACEPVQTIEPCAPVDCTGDGKEAVVIAQSCPTGACPIRTVARVAGNVVKTTVSFLDVANRARAKYGLPALKYDATLEAGATSQAQYCSNIGGLRHGNGAIEILAQNNQGLETAIDQWLASPGHRALLLNGGYRYAGVAVVRDNYGRCWCAMRFK